MNQTNMFADTNTDLPLFSGTAQRAQRESFKPDQASRQLDLLPKAEPWYNDVDTPITHDWGCLVGIPRTMILENDYLITFDDHNVHLWEMPLPQYEMARSKCAGGIPIINANARHEHIVIIKRALAAGKPVPQEVTGYIDTYHARDRDHPAPGFEHYHDEPEPDEPNPGCGNCVIDEPDPGTNDLCEYCAHQPEPERRSA